MLLIIEAWLRETIWGVLVLGALGSLVASLILYIGNKLFRKVLPAVIRSWFEREYSQGYLVGQIIGDVEITNNAVLAGSFLSYHTSRLIIRSIAGLLVFILLVTVLPTDGEVLLNVVTFLSATVFFILARLAYEDYRGVKSVYESLVLEKFKSNADDKDLESGKDNES